MKTGIFPILYAVISYMAIGLCFGPFLLLAWKKIRKENTYCVLGIYWLLNGLANLPALALFQATGSGSFFNKLGFYYDLAETPLVLLAFAFANPGRQRRVLVGILLLFIVGETLLISLKGYNFSSTALIIGAGLLLILVYSAIGLLQYMKKMEHSRFENSMAFVYAALLFGYGSFLMIYLFAHLHASGEGNSNADSFLLYYISLLLSSAVTSAGFLHYGGLKRGRGRTQRLRPHYSSSSS